jgi:hypothetical protein
LTPKLHGTIPDGKVDLLPYAASGDRLFESLRSLCSHVLRCDLNDSQLDEVELAAQGLLADDEIGWLQFVNGCRCGGVCNCTCRSFHVFNSAVCTGYDAEGTNLCNFICAGKERVEEERTTSRRSYLVGQIH